MVAAERARAIVEAELCRQEDRTAAFDAMRSAKEAAERADRTKTEFLAAMSHELRTPLNAILGFSDMMICEVLGPLGSERYRSYAQDIHASGSHLLDIINDVLDLSKAVAGKLELNEGWFDARNAVNDACRVVRQRITEANLRLTVALPPGELMLYADELKLKQMLLNLLSNAYKFTSAGGNIECRVTVGAAKIVFAVRDTGIGIPAAQLVRAAPFT
jgi:signal transduction histidine kinase